MSRAIDTANRTHDNWSERAYELLQRYLKSNSGEFMAEDVRAFAAMVDFPLPDNPRAWGGIFNKAVRTKLINKIGIGPVSNKKARRANANIYCV
jgi:hypothetical protein